MNENIVIIDGNSLTLNDTILIAKNKKKVKIKAANLNKLTLIRKHIDILIASEKPYYGINTGFGALSEKKISLNDLETLQLNLIYSHAVGIGPPISFEKARALVLLRLNTLTKGFSGCRPVIAEYLVKLLNSNCAPFVPQKGSVGASGDLAPLAHLGLLLLGEGNSFINGKVATAKEALQKSKLIPLKLKAKEGLTLINGTQAMNALACFAVFEGLNLCKLANIVGACTVEGLMGTNVPFNKKIHELRPYYGQQLAASQLRKMLKDSEISTNHKKCSRVQDAYSLRCMPQVHGAVIDAVNHANQQISIEINSATDNPLVFLKKSTKEKIEIISGGNFHGQPLAFVLDYLAISIGSLANISERRFEHLVNSNLSFGLPPFLINNAGLNSGFMILQVSASSLINENKILSHPASCDSIPTSANREDFVSMGMTSANKLSVIIDNVYHVLSLELMAACQAIDLRKPLKSAKKVEKIKKKVREVVSFIENDRILYNDMNKIYNLCKSGQLQKLADL